MKRTPTRWIRRAELAFVHTELRTGFTLARIAGRAARLEKKERNRMNARKAYDTAVRFTGKLQMTAPEEAELRAKLVKLQDELKLLGEVFGQRETTESREHRAGNGQKQ